MKQVKSSKIEETGVSLTFEDDSSSFFKFGTKADALMPQYMKNPTTGKVIGMSAQAFQDYKQILSDIGGFSPIAAEDRFVQSQLPSKDSLNLRGDIGKDGEEEDLHSSDAFSDQEDFDTKKASYEERLAGKSESIRTRIKEEETKKRDLIMSQFEPFISEAQEHREDITSATQAQFAIKRRLSTAALSFVQSQRQEAQKSVDLLVQKRADAFAQLDLTMADQIAEEIKEWKTQEFEWMKYETDLKKIKLDNFIRMGMYGIEKKRVGREAEIHLASLAAADWNIIKDIPKGETVDIRGITFTGIKEEEVNPFFKGSDIVNLMKSLPEGEATSITDPNTGIMYSVTGLKSADDIDLITFTDDRGNVTAFNKESGQPLWSAKGVGKTKVRAPSTTIILRQTESDALAAAQAVLEGTKDDGGFYDPAAYKAERLRFIQQTGKADLFDDQFKPHLDRTDNANIPFFTKTELEIGGNEWTPEAEEMYINTFGLDPADIEAAKAAGIGPKDLLR